MKKLVLALAVATLLVSPAIAQSATRGKAKVVEPPLVTLPLGAFAQSPPGALMSREQAVQECNADARGWPQTTYGHQEFDRYRACMTARPYGMTRRTANVGSRPPRRPLFFHPGFATKLSLRLEPNCGATIIELSLPLSRQAVAALIPSILG